MGSEDLDKFLSKKRVSYEEKLQWVKRIIDISIRLIDKNGTFVEVRNLNTRPRGVTHKSIMIQYITPFNKLPGAEDQYILDIWHNGHGKVFSVRWEPFTINNFKRGEWLYDLFE